MLPRREFLNEQGLIFGVCYESMAVMPDGTPPPEVAAAPATADAGEATPPRPAGLSPRAAQVITEIGDLARIDKSRRAQRIEPISLAAQSASGAGLAVLPASAAQP